MNPPSGTRPLLRNRMFLSFLLTSLPIFALCTLAVELALVPRAKQQVTDELTNASRLLASSINGSARVSIRNHLKSIAERYHDTATMLFDLARQQVITPAQAEARLRELLAHQSVGKSGYIYCINSRGMITFHPKPSLQNRLISQWQFIDEQIRRKNGYLEYDWQNPDDPAPRAKALYMIYFAPLDWIISVSCYREEFASLINPNDFSEAVRGLQFGKSGYAYVFDHEGNILIHPRITPANAFKTTQFSTDFAKDMIRQEHGIMTYDWRNPDDPAPRRKIVSFETIKQLDWIVVCAAYVDEVLAPVTVLRLFAYGAMSALLLAIAFTSYLLSVRLTRPIEAIISQLDANARENRIRPVPLMSDDEIGQLAGEFNEYLSILQVRESDLRQERARYQGLFQTSPDAILILRGQTIVDCNPTASAIFHCDKQRLIGHTIAELSPPRQPSGAESSMLADETLFAASTFPLQIFEWRHRRPDGTPFDAEVRVKPFDQDANGPCTVAFVRDISESKQSAAALQESQQRLRDIADNFPGVFYQFRARPGGSRCVTYLSDHFWDIAGCAYEVGNFFTLLQNLLRPEDRTAFTESLERAVNRAERWQFQGRIERPDGRKLWISLISSPQPDREELLYNGVLLDITERKQLEEQLHHIQKMDAIGQLAGGVAHDFNNMLGGILGAAELIDMHSDLPPQTKNYVALIHRTALRAADLTAKLLAFARKGKLENTPVNAAQALREAVAILRHSLDKRIDLILTDDQVQATVIGDSAQLQNIFLNLGINAGHAMPEGGTLTFRPQQVTLDSAHCRASRFTLTPGEYWEVEVRDTGCGIAPEHLDRIFEPFFTTRENGKGTGLGLAAVYGTVQEHHGEVTVYSEPNNGTLFRVRLPLAQEQEAAPREPAPVPESGTGRVLVVDDEEVIRITVMEMLQSLGYDVMLATNGREGLDLFQHDPAGVDVVLLDMTMPQMNGRECYEELRRIRPGVRVVIASGFADEAEIRRMRELGVCEFIRKPYRAWELSQALASALHRPSA